jgi:hypothetical protein
MSRQESFPPTSPLIPTDPNEKIAMAPRHDSVHYAQDVEVDELRMKVAELQNSEAAATHMRDQMCLELQMYKTDVRKKKDEIFDLVSESSKQSRSSKALENQMAKLREDTEKKVREIELELDREKKKKRTKGEQDAAKAIAQLQTEVATKDSKIEELEARLSEIKLPPDSTCEEVETSLANTQPAYPHHGSSCEEYEKLVFQMLRDAQQLQLAIEAEAEGLRHLAEANADLIDSHDMDLESIRELTRKEERYYAQIKHLEETIGNLRTEQRLNAGVFHDIELADPVAQPLGFSPMAHLCTTPVAPGDNKTEISGYMHRLRAAELDIESLVSEKLCLAVKFAELEVQLASSKVTLEAQEQDKRSLAFSELQAVSITPRAPPTASTPVANPALLAELEDLGKSINNLSDPPLKTATPHDKTRAQPDLLNVALTINIKPSSKRNYSFLQRIKSVISSTSKLDIHGPKEMIKQFVASMEDVEKDHAEKTQRVFELDKVTQQLSAKAEALEEQLRDRVKCLDPTHRTLADELAAKNEQFAMQEQLLTDFRRSTGT